MFTYLLFRLKTSRRLLLSFTIKYVTYCVTESLDVLLNTLGVMEHEKCNVYLCSVQQEATTLTRQLFVISVKCPA